MATSDWNMPHFSSYELDTSIYNGAPSSLRFNSPGSAYFGCMLKESVSGVVREGQVDTYWRTACLDNNNLHTGKIIFRYKKEDEAFSSNRVDFYSLQLRDPDKAYLSKNISGGGGYFNWDSTLVVNTWYRIRLSWWEGYNYQNTASTVISLERYIDSVWTELTTGGDDSNGNDNYLYRTDRLNQDETYQLVGLAGQYTTGSSYYCWFDDTLIYKA